VTRNVSRRMGSDGGECGGGVARIGDVARKCVSFVRVRECDTMLTGGFARGAGRGARGARPTRNFGWRFGLGRHCAAAWSSHLRTGSRRRRRRPHRLLVQYSRVELADSWTIIAPAGCRFAVASWFCRCHRWTWTTRQGFRPSSRNSTQQPLQESIGVTGTSNPSPALGDQERTLRDTGRD
jgi:hypothetical protein